MPQVPLVSSVDAWLASLLKSMNESLHSCIVDCIQDIDSGNSIEEWISKVCLEQLTINMSLKGMKICLLNKIGFGRQLRLQRSAE